MPVARQNRLHDIPALTHISLNGPVRSNETPKPYQPWAEISSP
jgi:hypothetical protein